jgi:hypothetical protein
MPTPPLNKLLLLVAYPSPNEPRDEEGILSEIAGVWRRGGDDGGSRESLGLDDDEALSEEDEEDEPEPDEGKEVIALEEFARS